MNWGADQANDEENDEVPFIIHADDVDPADLPRAEPLDLSDIRNSLSKPDVATCGC